MTRQSHMFYASLSLASVVWSVVWCGVVLHHQYSVDSSYERCRATGFMFELRSSDPTFHGWSGLLFYSRLGSGKGSSPGIATPFTGWRAQGGAPQKHPLNFNRIKDSVGFVIQLLMYEQSARLSQSDRYLWHVGRAAALRGWELERRGKKGSSRVRVHIAVWV